MTKKKRITPDQLLTRLERQARRHSSKIMDSLYPGDNKIVRVEDLLTMAMACEYAMLTLCERMNMAIPNAGNRHLAETAGRISAWLAHLSEPKTPNHAPSQRT